MDLNEIKINAVDVNYFYDSKVIWRTNYRNTILLAFILAPISTIFAVLGIMSFLQDFPGAELAQLIIIVVAGFLLAFRIGYLIDIFQPVPMLKRKSKGEKCLLAIYKNVNSLETMALLYGILVIGLVLCAFLLTFLDSTKMFRSLPYFAYGILWFFLANIPTTIRARYAVDRSVFLAYTLELLIDQNQEPRSNLLNIIAQNITIFTKKSFRILVNNAEHIPALLRAYHILIQGEKFAQFKDLMAQSIKALYNKDQTKGLHLLFDAYAIANEENDATFHHKIDFAVFKSFYKKFDLEKIGAVVGVIGTIIGFLI